jgi:hypothetical protein
MYGGSLYIHNTESQKDIIVYLKNNTYSKNIAYLAGNAVFISGCPWIDI